MAERDAPADAAPQDIAQLVVDHSAVLYRYAYRLSGSAPDAEDLTQQAFLIAQQKLDQLRDWHNARSWLFTILRNCYLKNHRRRPPRPLGDHEYDIDTLPQRACEQAVDSEQLQIALDALGDDFKMVVLLFYFEHRSYREIAELLELPPGTVMSRLARAKAYLRRQLADEAPLETPRKARGETHGTVRTQKKSAALGP